MSKITQDAARHNLPEEKLLGDWIVCIPGFELGKYRQLQSSRLSIFSVDCFGGMLQHTLGLPFRSPFINLFMDRGEFVEFMREPRAYMEKSLICNRDGFLNAKTNHFNYPIAKLGNVSLNMMHYKTFKESAEAWERRKLLINWDNLFVEMVTTEKELAEKFDTLPHDKKVCFVPFKSDLNSAWYVDPKMDRQPKTFNGIIGNFGRGKFFYYDPFDMLLYGKKTPLIDM